MLTLVTGTPGAGKSLYTVWEIARHVPGSTVEADGVAVPRRLLSNVKNLVLDHELITAEDLNTWHTWAKPGDVIVFDEVQEVWRPRGMGAKVPECIAALETHRHMGVDIVLITQHPMLVDPNIRRLVNQHLHLRRITRTVAMVYEWDHCANPGQVKTSIQSKVWMHPKRAYSLYKSAQLHTKPTSRLPRVMWLGVAALAFLAWAGPQAYARLNERMGGDGKAQATSGKPAPTPALPGPSAGLPATVNPAPVLPAVPSVMPPVAGLPDSQPKFAGCVNDRKSCRCYDMAGSPVQDQCEVDPQARKPLDLSSFPPGSFLAAADTATLQPTRIAEQWSESMGGHTRAE